MFSQFFLDRVWFLVPYFLWTQFLLSVSHLFCLFPICMCKAFRYAFHFVFCVCLKLPEMQSNWMKKKAAEAATIERRMSKKKDDKNHSKRCIFDMVDYRSAWCNNAINAMQVCLYGCVCVCLLLLLSENFEGNESNIIIFAFCLLLVLVLLLLLQFYFSCVQRFYEYICKFPTDISRLLFLCRSLTLCVCHWTKGKKYICYRCVHLFMVRMRVCACVRGVYLYASCVWVPTCFHKFFFCLFVNRKFSSRRVCQAKRCESNWS